eukprot:TRINITY_DN20770_c0_g1_i1.p1 TRINITY_DN20770_c0_g1~~TRINITY_DN20770_c0_g1_i1.p1  ORF type:complete len:301 (-),score=67.56 TRINITY_DN20770_c0_g1_i1:147-1049(-)
MIVVLGATGNVGAAAVQKLSEAGTVKVRALTRSSTGDKAAALKQFANVDVLECDPLNKEDVAKACAGATAACIAMGNHKDQASAEKTFIDCAVAAGCSYLVKLGTVRSYTAEDSPVEYARWHAEVERHLEKTSGPMKWTVLCPNWFMSNHLGDIFGTLPQGMIVYPADPASKFLAVDPRDVGELASKLLLASDVSRYHGLKLDVSGPEEVTMCDIALMYTQELGRQIQAVKCSKEEWIAGAMAAGFPDWLAAAIAHNFDRIDSGEMAFPNSPEVQVLGAPQRTMMHWIKEWAPRSPPAGS